MKHLFFLFFLGLYSVHLACWGQRDKIVTQAGQEIRCKILEESPSRFTYVYLDPTGKVKQSQIFKSLVKSFAYQVYSEDLSKDKIFQGPKKETEVSRYEVAKAKPAAVPKPPRKLKPLPPAKPVLPTQKVEEYNYKGWQLGFRGGLANYTAPLQGLSETSLPYYENLARGYTIGTEFHYFPTKFLGLGLIATATQSQARGTNVQYYNGFSNNFMVNDLETTRRFVFVGPSVQFRHILDPKAMVYTRLSGGRFFQQDAGFYAITPYQGIGQNWAGTAAVGFDFLLGKTDRKSGLALNLEASYHYAQQKQLDYGEGLQSLPSPVDLNHFSITLGFKWIQYPKKQAQ